jgi:molybdopterin converting factor small subunit
MGYLEDSSTHYFIPGIGIYNLDIEKAKPVKILYDFLDEVGEIDRLKNLDHLGDVREVIDGARHSRFDYIALIFTLIDNWDQKVDEIHAFSSVKFKLEVGEKEVKGKDLIKCWALLFNIGHLEWTFFTERILLEVLLDKKLHTKLIESIEDEKIGRKAEEIFELRDYNRLYQILAYLRFKCLYKKYRDKMDKNWFERYKWMFKKYIVDDFSDKVKESNTIYLKDLYRSVRKIAFLLLDSFYTPSGLNLSPVLLFNNPELIRSIIFDETEISNTLKFLNRRLYKSVYLNEKVLAVHSLYYSPLKEELLKKVEDLKNGKNVCEFIEEIYEGLNIQKIRKENRKRKSDYVPIMRFEFEGDDLNEQLKEELYKLPLVEINSNSNCYKVVWKTPLNFYVIQYNSNADKQSSIATLKESFDMVKKFLRGIKDKDNGASYIEHKRDVIERIAKRYTEQALKIFFNNEDIRWEWKHTSFLRSYFNFPDAVIGFVDDVYKFYWKNIISKFDEKYNKKFEVSEFYREKMRSIGKELEAKLEVVEKLKEGEESIKGKPDILCIAISNLIAYPIKQKRSIEQNITTSNSSVDPQEQNKYTGPIMEIDGLILGLTTEKQLFICLIEAKSGNEGATRAVRSKIRDHENDIFRGYDISNLINLVRSLNYNSTAYLIITDEKIPTFPNP